MGSNNIEGHLARWIEELVVYNRDIGKDNNNNNIQHLYSAL